MPAYKVIKSFPLSRDGITATEQVAGSVIDMPADAASGLVFEKYLELVPVPKPEPVVVERTTPARRGRNA